MKSVQQGRIRNPPPSQMNVIKPSNRTHLLVRDKKSSSMPIIIQAETELGKEGVGANRHVQDDCYSDVSKSSTVTSLDRTTSLLNMHTESLNTLTKTRADKVIQHLQLCTYSCIILSANIRIWHLKVTLLTIP